MAYYDDAYTWAQQHTTPFPVASRDPVSFPSYEPYAVQSNYEAYNVSVFQEPKSIDHVGYGYDFDYGNCDNWYRSTNPAINYFARNYMEPKLISYESIVCDTGNISYHTQYSISYSQVDLGFNEPEFEEYDTTPYGGGYDIISVYGKPLPPSVQTCYPPSKSKPTGPRLTLETEPEPTPLSIATTIPLAEARPESKPQPEPLPEPTPLSIATTIPLAEAEARPESKPQPEPLPFPISTHIPLPEPKPEPKLEPTPLPIATPIPLIEPEPKPEPEPKHVHMQIPLELKDDREKEGKEYSYPYYGYDYPWPEYDHSNATGVGYDYGYGKQMVQIPPCEYSPEVVDLCESIFGNWPCLARIRKQQMGIDNNPGKIGPEIGQLNPWEECASYIFGRPATSYNV